MLYKIKLFLIHAKAKILKTHSIVCLKWAISTNNECLRYLNLLWFSRLRTILYFHSGYMFAYFSSPNSTYSQKRNFPFFQQSRCEIASLSRKLVSLLIISILLQYFNFCISNRFSLLFFFLDFKQKRCLFGSGWTSQQEKQK